MHVHSHSERPRSGFPTSRVALAFAGFAIIAGALFFTEHRAHVLGALIWLPLLACPLMHVFMHHGHGGHRGHGQQGDDRKAP